MADKYKIVHNKEECIGCGACVAANPDFWEMGDDGKAFLKDSQKVDDTEQRTLEESFESNQDAAESCPVNCIHIYKITDDESEEKVI